MALYINEIYKWIFSKIVELHNTCISAINNLNEIKTFDKLFNFSHIVMFLTILIYIFYSYVKMNRFNLTINQYFREYKAYLVPVVILTCISLFSKEILLMTFNINNLLLNNKTIVEALNLTQLPDNQMTISTIIYLLTITAFIIFVTIIQFLECIMLVALLTIAPVSIVLSVFNPTVIERLIKYIVQGVVNPVVQTVIISMMVFVFLPVFMEQGELSSLMNLVIVGLTVGLMKNSNIIVTSLIIPKS